MIKTLFCFLFVIIYSGCSHVHILKTGPEGSAQFPDEINHKKTTLTLRGTGDFTDVRLIRMTPDSTFWKLTNGQILKASSGEIAQIQFVNRGRGALEGLGIGVLVGGITGAVIGLASGNDNEGFIRFSAGAKALMGAVFFGALGGLIGTPIGAAAGSRDIYHFENRPYHAAYDSTTGPAGAAVKIHRLSQGTGKSN